MSSIASQKKLWEGHAATDPLWAILTDPRFREGRWDVGKFFASGKTEVERLWAHLRSKGLKLPRRGRALDFGCGVGRLTQALAGKMGRADGVDISKTMIAEAGRFARLRRSKAAYHVNEASDLALFKSATFDLVYASIVLQHIPRDHTPHYLAELVRVLKRGGILAFNLPYANRVPKLALWRYRLRLRTRFKRLLQILGWPGLGHLDPHDIPMHVWTRAEVEAILSRAGAKLVSVTPTNTASESFYRQGLRFWKRSPDEERFPAFMYVAVK